MIFQYLRSFGKLSEVVASVLVVDKSSVLIIWRSPDGNVSRNRYYLHRLHTLVTESFFLCRSSFRLCPLSSR